MILAVVVVIAFLVLGIAIFLIYRYCKKRNSLPVQLRRVSDFTDGGLKRISILGSRYSHNSNAPGNKNSITTSETITSHSNNVSRIYLMSDIHYFTKVQISVIGIILLAGARFK